MKCNFRKVLSIMLLFVILIFMFINIGVTAEAATYPIYDLNSETSDFSDVFVVVNNNPFFQINNDTSDSITIFFETNSDSKTILSSNHPGYYRAAAGVNVGEKVCIEYIKEAKKIILSYYIDPPAPVENHEPAHVHKFEWQTITEPTKDSDGLEGEACVCGATRNIQKVSAYGYALNDYATPMINSSWAGQTVTFELGEWNSFPKAFMEKIAAKSLDGVTFVFHYKWNHEKQEIIIPYGTLVDTDYDWYGPAKMAELYGAN